MRDASSAPAHVCVGMSNAQDARSAAAEAAAAIVPEETCFVLAFVPAGLDREALAESLDESLGGIPVFGCTTAGQITTAGYETDALLLLGFPKANFRCASILLAPLNPLSITEIAAKAQRHAAKFQHTAGWNRLAMVLFDGLAKQEDLLISALATVLDGLPIFGGSAGDGLKFVETSILHGGRFHTNAGILLIIETNLGYQGLGFDHFLPAETQVVITQADPEERLVYEINGAPASQEYARLVGCPVEDLSPRVFAENPMLIQHASSHYVRAISDATETGALSFLAAIDDGLIMTLGRGREILETLEDGLDVRDPGGEAPDFVLGFDCVLRKLEIEQKQLGPAVSQIFRDRRVYGFNTYGEQHRGLHMNQTFVGIAFFRPQKGPPA